MTKIYSSEKMKRLICVVNLCQLKEFPKLQNIPILAKDLVTSRIINFTKTQWAAVTSSVAWISIFLHLPRSQWFQVNTKRKLSQRNFKNSQFVIFRITLVWTSKMLIMLPRKPKETEPLIIGNKMLLLIIYLQLTIKKGKKCRN